MTEVKPLAKGKSAKPLGAVIAIGNQKGGVGKSTNVEIVPALGGLDFESPEVLSSYFPDSRISDLGYCLWLIDPPQGQLHRVGAFSVNKLSARV